MLFEDDCPSAIVLETEETSAFSAPIPSKASKRVLEAFKTFYGSVEFEF